MLHLALLPPPGDKARGLARALIWLGPLAFGGLAILLGPDANWDLRNYHWYNAYAFLNGRHGFDLLPSQTPFFYSPILDAPVYLLGTYLPAKVYAFILGALQGLNFCLLFMLSHALLNIPKSARRVATAAALAAMGMLGGGGIAMIGTVFHDNLVSIGFLLSLLHIATTIPYLLTLPLRSILLSAFLYGVPAGMALGLKLTMIDFCAALPLAILCTGGDFRRRLIIAFAVGCGMTAGMLITQGYWMWHLWTHYQSPMFPYFNQIFGAPLAPPTSARDTQYIPHGWREMLSFPFTFAADPKKVGEIVWRDWRIPMLYALLLPCVWITLLVGRKHDRIQEMAPALPARFVLWTAFWAYLVWLLMFCIYRYLVILEMLAPLLIVLCIGMLPLKREIRFIVAGAILLVAAGSVKPGDWGRGPAWTDNIVQVLAPSVARPESTMLLMGGYEPYSHIIPFFPAAMPVTRIQSNFASMTENKGINRLIKERVAAHKGGFLLAIPAWQVAYGDVIQNDLRILGLKFDKKCREFPDNMGYSYALCPVQKTDDKGQMSDDDDSE
ncbi:MAG: hypothetical protein WDO70_08640 [Alphaproteobacteria bacterium]